MNVPREREIILRCFHTISLACTPCPAGLGAMYTPWISEVLDIQPITPQHWMELLGMALTVLVAMELHKTIRRRLAN